jgi:hypothetical protein
MYRRREAIYQSRDFRWLEKHAKARVVAESLQHRRELNERERAKVRDCETVQEAEREIEVSEGSTERKRRPENPQVCFESRIQLGQRLPGPIRLTPECVDISFNGAAAPGDGIRRRRQL